jgi:hypothetical protein
MGELAFGSVVVPLAYTYKIALASNRLQKNLYGGGLHEVVDYGAIDALRNQVEKYLGPCVMSD